MVVLTWQHGDHCNAITCSIGTKDVLFKDKLLTANAHPHILNAQAKSIPTIYYYLDFVWQNHEHSYKPKTESLGLKLYLTLLYLHYPTR